MASRAEGARPLAVPAALFAAGVAWLYACSLHRFTLGLHYYYIAGFEALHGRLPYRDFAFSFGPAPILFQALFFKLLGTSYRWGYVSHAALLNGLAPVLVFDTMRRRLSDWRPAALGAALTAFWFYAVFMAVPWYDHEAHFFIIAAVWALTRWRTGAGRFAAGLLCATSFFCKQSHGAFALVFLCFYVFLADGLGAAAAFTAGGTAGVFAWAAVFAAPAGFAPFWRQFVWAPLHSGRVSFTKAPVFRALAPALAIVALAPRALRRYALLAVPLAVSSAAIAVQSPLFLVFLAPLALWPLLEPAEERALLLALVLIQLDGRLTSNNEIKVYWPFLGLFFAWLAARWSERRVVLASWALLALWGARVSYGHMIQDPFPGTTLLFGVFALALAAAQWAEGRRLAAAGLLAACGGLLARAALTYRARLADPAFMARYRETRPAGTIDEPMLRGVEMRESLRRGLPEVLAALRALPPERKPIFLYQEADILYPLLGQPLPPFWLFDPTMGFKPGDGTEDRVIEDLERRGYGTWVWVPPFSEQAGPDGMPKLAAWLKEHATFEHDYEGFRVYAIQKALAR